MWTIFERVLADKSTTNNNVENWNKNWNTSLGKCFNIYRVIEAFKAENSLAKYKHLEYVAGRVTQDHPGRRDRKAARNERLKRAMQAFQRKNMKEYVFGLREDA